MRSIMSDIANAGDNLRNRRCRLHSLYKCRLCHYDGTYSLDIENPIHQAVISNFLAKSRKRNYREEIYERIYNKRRFVRRIREHQSREDPSAIPAEEVVVVLSSDDEDSMIATTPAQVLNINVNQVTSKRGKDQRVSRKYHHPLPDYPSAKTVGLPENIPNVSKNYASASKSMIRTWSGITTPAGTQGTMTTSVNYTSTGLNGVTYVSAPGLAESGLPTVRHTSLRAKNSRSAPAALATAVNPSSAPASTHTGTTTLPVNQSVPRPRITNYSAQWLSLPNPSKSSCLSSGLGSVSSSRPTSHQGKPDLTDSSDAVDGQGNTAALIPRHKQTHIRDAMNHTSPAMSPTRFEPSSVKTPLSIRKVRPSSSSGTRNTSRALIRKNPQVSSNIFIPPMTPFLLPGTELHKSQGAAHNSGSALTSVPKPEVQTAASENTIEVLPATCYNRSRGFVKHQLCSAKCSEGRCYIMKCRSKNCLRFFLGTNTDGNTMQEQSLLRTSPAQNFQPCLKCLRFSVEEETTISQFMRSSISQNKSSYNILIKKSAAEPSQKNQRKRALAGQSVARPLVLASPISEIDHSYGRQQPKAIKIPIKIDASPGNTLLPGNNQEKSNSPRRAKSRSPEAVESPLTIRLKDSSSTAPKTNAANSASAGPIAPAPRNDDIHNADVRNNTQSTAPTTAKIRNRRKCMSPKRKLPSAEPEPEPKIIQERVSKPYMPPYDRRTDDFIVVCEGRGFKVRSFVLEQASPVFKEFASKCCTAISIRGQEYRVFEILGVPYWAMYELLKFISCLSYNQNVMRTSSMKRVLEMLKIKYQQRKTFVFPVEPHIYEPL